MNEAQRIAVVTGSRADFGLLVPVMRAIDDHPALQLQVVAAGAHFLPHQQTWRDVAALFDIAASVEMQRDGDVDQFEDGARLADALGAGRGLENMARAIGELRPHWILVLGDRIEAFAAASAGSIAGVPVAHIHGGDRAEGVADEAMRHAITKLAHLHLPATAISAQRIEHMGEPPERIEVVGSPAIDGLDEIEALGDEFAHEFRDPEVLVLFHPIGDADETERVRARAIVDATAERRAAFCAPNSDPGRAGVAAAFEAADLPSLPHLPRPLFLALLKRLAGAGGVLVGNSSAGLIEAAAIGLAVVDIGDRQSGRERGENVVHTPGETPEQIRAAIETAHGLRVDPASHPYGDGRAGERIASAIAERASHDENARRRITRKRNSY